MMKAGRANMLLKLPPKRKINSKETTGFLQSSIKEPALLNYSVTPKPLPLMTALLPSMPNLDKMILSVPTELSGIKLDPILPTTTLDATKMSSILPIIRSMKPSASRPSKKAFIGEREPNTPSAIMKPPMPICARLSD